MIVFEWLLIAFFSGLLEPMNRPRLDLASLSPASRRLIVTVGVLLALLAWTAWPMLSHMISRWSIDPTYSHGYLVPLIALLILWLRRDSRPTPLESPSWWAIGLFAVGLILQCVGAFYYVRWLSSSSLVFYLGGIAVLVCGWAGLRWTAPALFFLFFMIPLPFRFENLMRQPLQRASTMASAFALQTFGLPAVTQGNIILLSDVQGQPIELGVVDACSGLKMLIVFFCLTTAFAILVKRPIGERLLILLSTIPIAMICNITRITVTGLLYATVGEKLANLVFHDLAGWLMMPMALLLLWGELWLLSVLFVDDSPDDQPVFRMSDTLPKRNVKPAT